MTKNLRPEENLLKFMVKRAITPSPLRNQYPKNGLKKIRNYLSQKSILDKFLQVYNSEVQLNEFLDIHTNNMVTLFDNGQLKWGSARKALNIYLRDLSLQFLMKDNNFDANLKYLEIPLDSYVANGLKGLNSSLPKFVSIKNTNKKDYFIYQKFAYELAEKNETSRIHLDLIFYPVE